MRNNFNIAALQKALPWAFLLLMGTAWGLSFSLGKIAVENGAKPFGVAQFQAMFAGVVLLSITVIRRKSIQDMKDKLGFIFCVAMLGAAIPAVLFYYAALEVYSLNKGNYYFWLYLLLIPFVIITKDSNWKILGLIVLFGGFCYWSWTWVMTDLFYSAY